MQQLQTSDTGRIRGNRLHIGYIPFRWGTKELECLVRPYGNPEHAEVINNNRGSMGFGFVTMPSVAAAETVIRKLNGLVVDGRKIEVNFASPRRTRPNKAIRTWNSDPDRKWAPAEAIPAVGEPPTQRTKTSNCQMSDGKRVTMAEIQHLRAVAHEPCKTCQPLLEASSIDLSPKTTRSLSSNARSNHPRSCPCHRRAVVATNHIWPPLQSTPTGSPEVATTPPVGKRGDDFGPLFFDSKYYQSHELLLGGDSGLYDMTGSSTTATGGVSNFREDENHWSTRLYSNESADASGLTWSSNCQRGDDWLSVLHQSDGTGTASSWGATSFQRDHSQDPYTAVGSNTRANESAFAGWFMGA